MAKKKQPWKKEPKPKTDSQLMMDVEKTNPEFVQWLKSRKGGRKG